MIAIILSLALRCVRVIVRALRTVERWVSARLRARREARARRTLSELTPGDCVEDGCVLFWGGCLRCGAGDWDPSRLTLDQVPSFLRSQVVDKIRVRTILLVDVDEGARPRERGSARDRGRKEIVR